MIRLRILAVLAGLGLAAASLSGPAWAHPGHGPIGAPAASHQVHLEAGDRGEVELPGADAARSGASQHDHGPPAAALVAGALALLAALPRRRRTLALTFASLLAMAAFEGVVHAALHLGRLPHPDTLAIGASAAPPAAPEWKADAPAPALLAPAGQAPDRYAVPPTDVVVASNRGRAPPLSSV